MIEVSFCWVILIYKKNTKKIKKGIAKKENVWYNIINKVMGKIMTMRKGEILNKKYYF